MEFALVFPFLLFIILAILQLGFIYSARQMVNYAAFCAARSAIVYKDAGRAKKAALIACIPISPPISALVRDLTDIDISLAHRIPEGMGLVNELQPLNSVLEGTEKFIFMVASAYLFTQVEFLDKDGKKIEDLSSLNSGDDITVKVTYYYYLMFPLVNAVIGDSLLDMRNELVGETAAGYVDKIQDWINLDQYVNLNLYFLKLEAQTTLTVELTQGDLG